METLDIAMKLLSNLGGLGLLALLIFRLPPIIEKYNSGVDMVVKNVRDVQKENLDVFREQMTADRSVFVDRFGKIESALEKMGETLVASMQNQTEIIHSQERIHDRLDRLEAHNVRSVAP